MVQKTFKGIRNERWLYDARFMQKHMDLHLIDLLEDKKVDEVLNKIRYPKRFYAEVLHRLIAQKVPTVKDEWKDFKNHLSQAIKKAAAVQVDSGRAQAFVDQLRKEFFEGYLQSETLNLAFRIDCSGEYEDCDNEGNKEFQEACTNELHEVLAKQPAQPVKNQEDYAKELSPKVVQLMITSNDKAALPRCDACCQLCKSLCIEAAKHGTPHDAVHQPGGVAGFSYHPTNELVEKTCCRSYEQDNSFFLNGDDTKWYKYKDYATVFPGWKDPRIFEELPVREYILATYNKQIAAKYDLKPSTNIPKNYHRDLSSIKKQLEMEIAGLVKD
jgi:ribosomal protein L12E/L44/L45/RPP1/RPP2